MYSATGVEPTKLTAATRGSVSSVSTASRSPLTTLNTPSGSPASLQQLGDAHRTARILLGRLQHERVAAGDRDREHPHRHHRREVERRDAGADADRLALRPAVDAGADVLAELALQQLRDAAGELDDLDAAVTSPRASDSTLPCSAVISRASSSVCASSSALNRNMIARALQRRRRRPGRQRGLGRRDGRPRLVGAGKGHFAPDLAGGRVVHGPAATGGPATSRPPMKWPSAKVSAAVVTAATVDFGARMGRIPVGDQVGRSRHWTRSRTALPTPAGGVGRPPRSGPVRTG